MKTLGEVLTLSVQYLQDRNISRPRRQAEDLMSRLLEMQRIQLYMHYDRPLEDRELDVYRSWIFRRGKGEPLDYILKEVTFFDCSLEIDYSVLIPRPETEILVDMACSKLQQLNLKNKIAWDLCCGSGCIGLGIKKKFPEIQMTLSDISPDALAIAKKNAKRNGLDVSFIQGDLLVPYQGKKADFIFCNPPYISSSEYADLDDEVAKFEPRIALLAGETGFEFYERLALELPKFLAPNGRVFLEIGFSQGSKIISLFDATCWKIKHIEKDWSGHDRFFFLEME